MFRKAGSLVAICATALIGSSTTTKGLKPQPNKNSCYVDVPHNPSPFLPYTDFFCFANPAKLSNVEGIVKDTTYEENGKTFREVSFAQAPYRGVQFIVIYQKEDSEFIPKGIVSKREQAAYLIQNNHIYCVFSEYLSRSLSVVPPCVPPEQPSDRKPLFEKRADRSHLREA